MKDKLKNMFKGKKKTENLIVLIIILIVTVVAINYIWKDEDKNTDEISNNSISRQNLGTIQVNSNYQEDDLEKRLENILSKISGVGNVKVMVTYSESSMLTPIFNEDSKESSTDETDSSGGTRAIKETDTQKEVVYKENNDGSKEVITQSISSPKVEGAIVVAQGADSLDVKASIIQAIEAATGLATHKIQVFKMVEGN